MRTCNCQISASDSSAINNQYKHYIDKMGELKVPVKVHCSVLIEFYANVSNINNMDEHM